jgi:hypothetical protein
MKELYVFCEGPTEQAFCQRLLQPELFPQHDGLVHPVRIAHSRRHGVIHRGGVRSYAPLRNDMVRHFRQHQRDGVLFTSLIDLYGLPGDFPGKTSNQRNPDNPRPYVEAIEQALADDLDERRFVPHLQLHEFETLLFAEPAALGVSFDGCENEIVRLTQIATDAGDIEKINDTQHNAPSKRIIREIPAYERLKTTVGPDVAECIGMPTLRAKCAHFSDWILELQTRLGAD